MSYTNGEDYFDWNDSNSYEENKMMYYQYRLRTVKNQCSILEFIIYAPYGILKLYYYFFKGVYKNWKSKK